MTQNRDKKHPGIHLTAEQIAEIERRFRDDGPYTSENEVRAVFDRLTKKARIGKNEEL
jgi:hypothetical protein